MIPVALESFDWQWRNGGVAKEHPEYDLLPSEYFRRQIYGCFWYERETISTALLAYPDNMLFETDFPHPTCQHPGPSHSSGRPGSRTRRRHSRGFRKTCSCEGARGERGSPVRRRAHGVSGTPALAERSAPGSPTRSATPSCRQRGAPHLGRFLPGELGVRRVLDGRRCSGTSSR